MPIQKKGKNTRVTGQGGSVTWGPTKDPQHPGQKFISVNTGKGHHSTYVTGKDSSGTSTLKNTKKSR
jgi:hypothetical protein